MSESDDLSLTSYEDVVDHFLRHCIEGAEKEAQWFGPRCKTLADCIGRACLSEIPTGRGKTLKRHSHQTRIPRLVLAEAKSVLLQSERSIAACSSFAELYSVIDDAIGAIPGVGALLVYDIAHRVGGFLQIEPNEVYLHTGARLGAIALGLDTRRSSIPVNEFPNGLRKLSAAYLEDVLCIYRSVLVRLHTGRISKTRRSLRRC